MAYSTHNGSNKKVWLKLLLEGTVLGPRMFLMYTNDIASNIMFSKVRLFADDCLLYRIVDGVQDRLQRDLSP